ncbi:unnamed protein product [Staurois parvus]|uniref:Uncharacterized protein n=1 Tax=Staurois parvus TaxID=386267 RepID=A0ABN9BX45_9NEOB|nr:unnamed protein product [Staurois parvus]
MCMFLHCMLGVCLTWKTCCFVSLCCACVYMQVSPLSALPMITENRQPGPGD